MTSQRRGRRARSDGRAPRPVLGGEQVEGLRAVRELLAARRRRTIEVLVADRPGRSASVDEVLGLAVESGTPVRHLPKEQIEHQAATSSHQGVLARAEPLPETPLDELCVRGADGRDPFLVVVDGVTDPHNLGALVRSASFAGATGVVIGRHRAVHVTPTVAKAAAGAIEHVPLSVVAGIPSALADMARRGIWRVGLDSSAGASLYDLRLARDPLALVLGSEGEGLGRLTRQRCDLIVSIPRLGQMESLNVSVAGAVACLEVARYRALGRDLGAR